MKSIKKIITLLLLSFSSLYTFAQTTGPVTDTSNSFMDSNGKIYVVVAIVVLIMIGLFLYLINLDRKISKLEKEHK